MALVYEFSDAGPPWQVASPTHTTSDKTLTVATHVSPHTYYETQSGPSGFEYTLLSLFAQDLGLELVINTTETVEELFAKICKEDLSILESLECKNLGGKQSYS